MNRAARLSLISFATAALLSTQALAASDVAVDDFVKRVNAAISSGDAQGACRKLVGQIFDLDAMAPNTSAGAWTKMSAAQKAAYRAALSRQATGDCVSRASDFVGQTLDLVGARSGEGGDRFIATKGKGRTLIWQVRGTDRLRAVDISANGRSLVVKARNDAKAILQRTGGDLQALIASVGD